ncbi:cobalamin biosynthesis protein CbiM [Heliobacillus mobilis]|uniref:Cobalamin biosynthesis protein CbiM n=1 Tax=Heliobacterium mobile TaxID=28064 RepID=A0A6I3SIQ2_HELMO|nr:energy-coupling factor ABC transporter permease [Heliobacterium mobile]MTV48686.1 cobalamin biosynthesis protein CbiM [Heliobacterium mobile]
MHIPDHFLSPTTWIGASAISGGALAYAAKKTQKKLDERQVPWMGVMGAFIFAAQMVNFPVAGGTSGHLLGSMLAAVVLGPWPTMIIMSTILGIQCLFFQDGGITALGANILNMAVVGTWTGYGTYRLLLRLLPGTWGQKAAIFAGGWMSVFLASIVAAFELAFSDTLPLSLALPAMAGWHSLIGIGEGLITVAVIQYLLRVKPELNIAPIKGGMNVHG